MKARNKKKQSQVSILRAFIRSGILLLQAFGLATLVALGDGRRRQARGGGGRAATGASVYEEKLAEAAVGLQLEHAIAQYHAGSPELAAMSLNHFGANVGSARGGGIARELAGAAVGLMLRRLPSEVPQHALHGALLDDVLVISGSGVFS